MQLEAPADASLILMREYLADYAALAIVWRLEE